MKYYLIGHTRSTAVQDTLICLLPQEQHLQATQPDGDDVLTVELVQRKRTSTVTCNLLRGGKQYRAVCRTVAPTDDPEQLRWEETRAIKTAVYKTVCQIVRHKPVWGAQTGVKPAKIIRFDMQQGMTDAQAHKYMQDHFFIAKSRRDLCLACAKEANACEAQLGKKEIQLYIGIAFCPAKCSYCSFVSNSVQKMGHLLEPYVRGVLREIEAVSQMVASNGCTIGSIYIGGGTPTVLDDSQFERLLRHVDRYLYHPGLREYSVEAGRPETINRRKLELMGEFGVSRMSINPQSMVDSVLRGVGRNHSKADIVETYNLAREVGNFIINMDLIAGLPGDTEAGLLSSVQQVAALEPENITIHSLSKKKGAAVIYEDHYELAAKSLDKAHKYLHSKGYNPYYIYRQKYIAGGLENTGFEKGGTASFYNVAMMEELCTVVAIGAGGVSKILDPDGIKISRVANPKYPKEYIDNLETIIETKRNLRV